MTDELYDEAIAQMGAAPPEPNENLRPRRRGRRRGDGTGNRGGGRQSLPDGERARKITITLPPELLAWVDSLGPKRATTIAGLLTKCFADHPANGGEEQP